MIYLESSKGTKIPTEVSNNNSKLTKALKVLIGGPIALVAAVSACFIAMGIMVAVGGMFIFISVGLLVAALAAIPIIVACCLTNMVLGDANPLIKIFKKNKSAIDKEKEHESDKKKLKDLEKLSKMLQNGIDKIEEKRNKLKKKIADDEKRLKESTILIDKVKII